MASQAHTVSYGDRPALGWASAPASLRRWVVAAIGCAAMALSGGGLAGYLDLSSATAADAPSSGAAPAPDASAPDAPALNAPVPGAPTSVSSGGG